MVVCHSRGQIKKENVQGVNVSSGMSDRVSGVNGIDIWDAEVSKVRRRSKTGLKCL